MKKLLIAMAAVACAFAVNAAAINWAATGNLTDASGNVLTSATAPSGNLVLVYLGTTTDYDWADATVVDTATVSYTSSMGKTSAKATGKFEFAANVDYKNGDVFGVLYQDAGKLFYLQDSTGGNMEPTYTISGLADDTSSLAGFTFSSSSFYTTTAPSAAVVPEPTSALLLVLGMAGLALRRKSA